MSCNAREGTVGADEFEASAKSPKSSSTSSCCGIGGGFLAQNVDGFVGKGKVFTARAAKGSLSELCLFILFCLFIEGCAGLLMGERTEIGASNKPMRSLNDEPLSTNTGFGFGLSHVMRCGKPL